MTKIEHKGLNLIFDLPDFLQRDLEAFYRARREIIDGLTGIGGEEFGERIIKFVAALDKASPKLNPGKFTASVYEFSNGLRAIAAAGDVLSGPENVGVNARAAARCGWLGDVMEDDVDEMSPAAVTWISSQIQDGIVEALTIPGE